MTSRHSIETLRKIRIVELIVKSEKSYPVMMDNIRQHIYDVYRISPDIPISNLECMLYLEHMEELLSHQPVQRNRLKKAL